MGWGRATFGLTKRAVRMMVSGMCIVLGSCNGELKFDILIEMFAFRIW